MLEESPLRQMPGALSGEVDLAVAHLLVPQLLDLAISAPGSTVVIDCAELTFIDSSGVNVLLRVSEQSGKSLRLENLSSNGRRVFEILGLCERFGIERRSSNGHSYREGFY